MIYNKKHRTRKYFSIILILFMIQSLFLPALATAQADGNPPVVESVEVGPKEVTVGETVTIRAKLTDSISNVDYVAAYFRSPSGNKIDFTFLYYNPNTGLWEGTYLVQANDEAGEWEFYILNVYDEIGNKYTIHLDKKFVVHNEYGDGLAPVVESIEISPIEVGVGEELTIKAKITDDISGVDRAAAYFRSPSGNKVEYTLLYYNPSSDLWEGTYLVQANDEAGEWEIYIINVYDVVGNKDTIHLSEKFVIHNEDGDGSAPVVESIEINLDEVAVGEEVIIKAKITDDITGVDRAAAYFRSPSGNKIDYTFLYYNPDSGLWEGSYRIQANDEAGEWEIFSINVYDKAENKDTLFLDIFFMVTENNSIIEDPINNPNSPYHITTTNQTWTNETINKDVYIGPESLVTINGNVEITGDVYVYGALRNYGNLKINGTLHAKKYTNGYSSPLYQGTVEMLGGTNSIPSMKFTNQPYDIPFEIVNEPKKEMSSVYVEGKTLPFFDVYVQGDLVPLEVDGTFRVTVDEVRSNEIVFDIYDGFGYLIKKPVEVIDYDSPARPTNFQVSHVGTDTIEVTWDKNLELDIKEYILYQNGEQVAVVSKDVQNYTFKHLSENQWYQFFIIARDYNGNQSEPVFIEEFTNVSMPIVEPVSDQDFAINGTAAIGALIKVFQDGVEVIRAVADHEGKFSIFMPNLVADTELLVVAIGDNGVESNYVSVQVQDKTPPEPPEVSAINEDTVRVTGEAEPGAIVTVYANGVALTDTIVTETGRFELFIEEQLPNTELIFIATDSYGHDSLSTVITVQAVEKELPIVDEEEEIPVEGPGSGDGQEEPPTEEDKEEEPVPGDEQEEPPVEDDKDEEPETGNEQEETPVEGGQDEPGTGNNQEEPPVDEEEQEVPGDKEEEQLVEEKEEEEQVEEPAEETEEEDQNSGEVPGDEEQDSEETTEEEPTIVEFTDIKPGKSHFEGVQWLADKGIQGYGDGSFGVNKSLTRPHTAIMFVRALGLELPEKHHVQDYFHDVSINHPYAEFIAAVAEAGIFKGQNGKFLPGKQLTREQMASTLVNAYGFTSGNKKVDINLSNVSKTHRNSVQILANLGITNQLDNFRPKEIVTRGQFATFLYLANQVAGDK